MANPTGKGGFQERKQQINRDGRPKDSPSLSALVRRIGHEKATTKDGTLLLGPDGKPMTVVEAVVRQRFQDKRYQGEMLDRGWGKVANPVDITSGGKPITGYALVSPDDWDNDKDASAET